VLGAFLVNFAKTYLTGAIPEIWLFALGGLFIAVTLLLPKGILGLLSTLRLRRRPVVPRIAPEESAPAGAAMTPRVAE
jgi:urea transport system permease protein